MNDHKVRYYSKLKLIASKLKTAPTALLALTISQSPRLQPSPCIAQFTGAHLTQLSPWTCINPGLN